MELKKISKKIKIGDKYNRLTALEFDSIKTINYKSEKRSSGSYNRHWNYWKFKCDCGKEKILNIDDVIYNHTKSCGCLLDEFQSNKSSYNVLSPGEGSFNYLLRSYIKGAKNRNHKFLLSSEEFRYLTKQNCHYCGTPPLQETLNAGCNGKYIYNGVDRIDSNEDYVFENCVSCCKHCNMAKGKWSKEDFNNWIKRLVNFNKGLINE